MRIWNEMIDSTYSESIMKFKNLVLANNKKFKYFVVKIYKFNIRKFNIK